ncbi:hypothetical protein ACS0TY_027774 [Phlomoides rotata]
MRAEPQGAAEIAPRGWYGSVSGSINLIINHRGKGNFRVSSSLRTLEFKESNTKEIWGKTLNFSDQRGLSNLSIKSPNLDPVQDNTMKCWIFVGNSLCEVSIPLNSPSLKSFSDVP